MFHFTRKRIEAHVCFCFVALKVYKELERMLKVSEIRMSVDKVLALAKTITTIQIKLPLNKDVYTQTMLMARHQKIAKLFDEDFWVTRWQSQDLAGGKRMFFMLLFFCLPTKIPLSRWGVTITDGVEGITKATAVICYEPWLCIFFWGLFGFFVRSQDRLFPLRCCGNRVCHL